MRDNTSNQVSSYTVGFYHSGTALPERTPPPGTQREGTPDHQRTAEKQDRYIAPYSSESKIPMSGDYTRRYKNQTTPEENG